MRQNKKDREDFMGLEFLLGRAYAKADDLIFQDALSFLQADEKHEVFYLVPDHIKFSAELNALNFMQEADGLKDRQYASMIRFQVYSFSRLAWHLLKDQPIIQKAQLTETGTAMIVQKILNDQEDNLKVFRGESRQAGFVEKLSQLFDEFRQGCLEPADLGQMLQKEGKTVNERSSLLRLADFQLLYSHYLEEMAADYIEQVDVLQALSQEIQARDLQHVRVYIQYFDSFTSQEQEVILALLKTSDKLTVALNLDQQDQKDNQFGQDLFHHTKKTYYRLKENARLNGIPLLEDQFLDQDQVPLSPVENYLYQSQIGQEAESADLAEHVSIIGGESKQAEVTFVATEIRKLIKKGYRFKDILVTARSLEDYQDIIQPLFLENDLPLFIDQADSMANHPLNEFLQTLLNLMKGNWRYSDIIRFLRTELFITDQGEDLPKDTSKRVEELDKRVADFRQQVDILENVILAYGYQGWHWKTDKEWDYAYQIQTAKADRQDELAIQQEKIANNLRFKISKKLKPFFKKMAASENVQEAANHLYNFLLENKVDQQILYWRDQAIENQELESGRDHEQAWSHLCQILDEWVTVMGQEPFHLDQAQEILKAGFENATYSIVPPSIDQVTFSNYTSLKASKSKVAFILGLSSDQLPLYQENKSLLTDEDREWLSQSLDEGKYIRPSSLELSANEAYVAYQAFAQASEKLYLLYPEKSAEDKELQASPFINRLADFFDLEFQQMSDTAALDLDNPLAYVGSAKESFGQLIRVFRRALDEKKEAPAFWLQLYRIFVEKASSDPYYKKIAKSLQYDNKVENLDHDLAEKLYGTDLYLSVSRLEGFYLDPFSHFLDYGLRLKERQVLELSPLEKGNFFHEALDQISKYMADKQLDLTKLSFEDLERVVNQQVNQVIDSPAFVIFKQSSRMTYQAQQLKRTLQSTMKLLKYQQEKHAFRPVASELAFGPGRDLNFNLDLETGNKIYLRGVIDRLDKIETKDRPYFAVVDYKSSSKNLNIKDVYYGLAMQMLTYLQVIEANQLALFGEEVLPAAAWYMTVTDPYYEVKKDMSQEEIQHKRLSNQHKLKGFLLDDAGLLDYLADSLDASETSALIPINKLKSGEVKNKAGIHLDQSDFRDLLNYNKLLIKEAGRDILKGEIGLKPFYEKMSITPSVSGKYHPISQFDPLLKANSYREQKDIDLSHLQARLKGEEPSDG